MQLSESQLRQIQYAMETGTFSFEYEVQKLVEQGFEHQRAEALISEAAHQERQRLFKASLNKQKNSESRQAGSLVIFMVSLLGPVLDIVNPLWYICAALIAGAAGYYAYKDKPVAGITASLILLITFPFAYHFYFSGRTSYINLELVIPLLMALLPAFLIYLLLSKLIYPDNDPLY